MFHKTAVTRYPPQPLIQQRVCGTTSVHGQHLNTQEKTNLKAYLRAYLMYTKMELVSISAGYICLAGASGDIKFQQGKNRRTQTTTTFTGSRATGTLQKAEAQQ